MNSKQRKTALLRPGARDARYVGTRDLLRQLANLLLPYLSEGLSTAATSEQSPLYYDQSNSPLGRRRHLDLARAKLLESWKVGRRVFIKREAVHGYIEAHVPVSTDTTNDNEDDPEADDVLPQWGLRRAEKKA